MTLLTICQSAADEVKITRPSSVVGSTDSNSQALLRLANKVGTRLMKKFPWQDLRKEQTAAGVSGATQTDILPSDFDRFIPETFWNRSASRLISGPISSVEWQGRQATSYTGQDAKFIYRGGAVLINPALAGGESLAFEYVSTQWCQSAALAGQSAFAADTDTAILSEELITLGVIYEFLSGEGLPTAAAAQDYVALFDTLVRNDQPTANILSTGDIFGNGRHFTGTPPVSASYLDGLL